MIAIPPYSNLVGSDDPISLLASTPKRITELVRSWDISRWSRSYAAGKWSAAEIVLHLAHDEIGWCNRIRLALTVDGYAVQPYDGADWIAMETPTDPATALEAYVALRRLNIILYARITPEQLARPFFHPELGEISIDWILRTLAGHDLHHLHHLEMIASI
jgi:DinB family protein